MDNRPIGIFDSGVGGLTVVGEVMKALPNEEIIYFGDTARVPYGSKSKETVVKYSKQITAFLIEQNVKCIIIACNTASSNSYDELVNEFDIPIIEVVTPGVEAGIAATKNNIVGVIGTERTIESGAHEKCLKKLNRHISVYTKACPLFVPLAEEGWTNNSVAQMTAEIYLQELIDKQIDTLLLGCTHYPLLLDCIRRAAGRIKIIDPAAAAAEHTKVFLDKNNLSRNISPVNYTFYVTDNTKKFDRICSLVLNHVYGAKIAELE